jgi:hypothetical protein
MWAAGFWADTFWEESFWADAAEPEAFMGNVVDLTAASYTPDVNLTASTVALEVG